MNEYIAQGLLAGAADAERLHPDRSVQAGRYRAEGVEVGIAAQAVTNVTIAVLLWLWLAS